MWCRYEHRLLSASPIWRRCVDKGLSCFVYRRGENKLTLASGVASADQQSLSIAMVWGLFVFIVVFFKLLVSLHLFHLPTLTFSCLMTYIYICLTAPISSRSCILYINSTNIRTEYFKHAAHSPFFLFKMPFISQCYLFWFLYYSHFKYRVC